MILGTVTLSAIAQIALKIGVSSLHMASGRGVASLLLAAMSSPFIWLGLAIYGVSVIAWLWILSRVEVSVAYPFVGVSFLLTAVMGAVLLHEHVTPLMAGGTLLVFIGCVLIARSA